MFSERFTLKAMHCVLNNHSHCYNHIFSCTYYNNMYITLYLYHIARLGACVLQLLYNMMCLIWYITKCTILCVVYLTIYGRG